MAETTRAAGGKVLWHTTMSLDGYVAAPGDRMEWMVDYDYADDGTIDAVIADTGAILMGRNSFDMGGDETQPEETQEAFGGRWHGPQFVLSHRPPPADYDDALYTFLNVPAAEAIARVRAAAGGGDVLLIGATLAGGLLAEGLVDELLIHVLPILLGDGIRLYGDAITQTVKLDLIEARKMGETATLRLRPAA